MIVDLFILFGHRLWQLGDWFGRKVLGRSYTRAENEAWLKKNCSIWAAQANAESEIASWRYEPTPEAVGPSAPTDKMQLGNHAKRLLDDPVMRLAFDGVAADLTKTWRDTRAEDAEKREEAWRMLRILEGVEHKLQLFARNTTVEERRREVEEARSRS
jgi:hypothetical protein